MQFTVVNDFESLSGQAANFFVVVYDVPQAIEIALLLKDFFRHFDGVDYPKAKARMIIYLNL
jgi:hypothetical protein